MKILNRILLPLLVALMFITSATAAIAQGSGKIWVPEFNPEQHVYIDSGLEEHRSMPVSLPRLPAEIERAQREHNLKIYVVATEQGSDSSPSSSLAAEELDKLILKWSSHPDFPKDDYLVIMWVRFKDEPTRGSVAANGGNRLRGYGMSAGRFSSSSGPVIPVLKQHMRERPELALITIIDNVNAEVTSAIQAQQNAAARQEAMKALPGLFLKWGLIVGGVLLVLFVLIRFARARSRMNRLRSRFENQLDGANELLAALKKDHARFLNAQKDWQTRFKGTSLERLTAGLTAYSELLSVSAAASKRLAEVRRASGKYWFPRVQGCLDAIELLIERDITVSSKEIDLEMTTLFGGVTVDKIVDPKHVFSNGSALSSTTDAALKEIAEKLALNDSTAATVSGILNWCREQKARFEQEKLSITPYEGSITDLDEDLTRFQTESYHDPVGMLLEAPALSEQADALKARIERAFALADEIEVASQTLAATVKRVDTIRATKVEYRFPDKDATTLTRNYRLSEDRGDPDPIVHEAAGLLMKAFDQLELGLLDAARETLDSAKDSRDSAEKLIDAVFTAKEAVETNGTLVASTKAELSAEITDAGEALAALKRDFLEINFPDAQSQYDGAVSSRDEVDSQYAEVRGAYDRQFYLLASQLLAVVLADIEAARQDCAAIQDSLEHLTACREESRTSVPVSRKHAARLGPKLVERSFTTSAADDTRYGAAVVEVGALEAIVKLAVADWVDARDRAGTLKQALIDIETACDTSLSLYEEAFASIDSLPADVESAFISINKRTLHPARDAHSSAAAELEALSREVDVPKSDWLALRDRANKAHDLCQTCRDKAATNDRQAESAAKHLAYCKVRARRFSHRKHKYLTEANRLYALARTAYAKRDWEDACKLSIAAFKEFVKYDRQYKRRLATLVVKGGPGAGSSAPATASGSTTASDDGFSAGVAIAIGMSMGSGNPAPAKSGSSSSSSSSSSSYSTPSYSSSSGGSPISISTGGASFGGGSGGGGY